MANLKQNICKDVYNSNDHDSVYKNCINFYIVTTAPGYNELARI